MRRWPTKQLDSGHWSWFTPSRNPSDIQPHLLYIINVEMKLCKWNYVNEIFSCTPCLLKYSQSDREIRIISVNSMQHNLFTTQKSNRIIHLCTKIQNMFRKICWVKQIIILGKSITYNYFIQYAYKIHFHSHSLLTLKFLPPHFPALHSHSSDPFSMLYLSVHL